MLLDSQSFRSPNKGKVFWSLFFFSVGAIGLLWILSPAFESSYYWDDVLASLNRGAQKESGLNFFELYFSQMKELFYSQGRIFPLSGLSGIPFFFFDALGAKIWNVSLVFVNLAFFSVILQKITRNTSTGFLTWLLAPVFFQFQYIFDSILNNGGLIQWLFFWFEISLLFFIYFLDTGKKIFLFSSTFFFLCSLLTYEVSYPFFLVYPLISRIYPKKKASIKQISLWSAPFLGVVLIVICSLFAFRIYNGLPWTGGHQTYTPTSIGKLTLLVLFKHSVASIPMSYILLSPFREFYHLSFQEVKNFWFSSNLLLGTILFFLLSFSLLLFFLRYSTRVPAKKYFCPLGIFGLLLVVLPGVLISHSSKYQSHSWIDWGYSYIPLYVSMFGSLTLSVILVHQLLNPKNRFKVVQAVVLTLVCFLFGLAGVSTYFSNRIIVTSLNREMKTNTQQIAVESLKRGILDNILPQAYLMVNSDFPTGSIPAFYRQYSPATFRKVVTSGHFLGTPSVSWNPYYYSSNTRDVPLPARSFKMKNGKSVIYEFSITDAVYYIQFESNKYGVGYAFQAQISRFLGNEEKIQEATSQEVRIYTQNMNLSELCVTFSLKHPSHSSLLQKVVPLRDVSHLNQGTKWTMQVLQINQDDEISLTTLKILPCVPH